MKTFKLLFGIFSILFIVSCSSSSSTDKKAELEKLRKKHDDITRKIEQLEKEVNENSDSVYFSSKLVAITPIVKQKFEHYIEVQGKLDGDETVGVSPLIASRVIALNVKVGDYVRRGQVLAVLDDKATGQSLEVLRNNLELTTDMYERQKRLYEQKIGSEVSFLEIKNKKETLEQSISSLEDMINIKSPIDGTVEEVDAKIGQMVSPQLPAFRVVSFKKLKVKSEVAEAYSSKIHVGDKVDIYFPDVNTELTAVVTSASKYINPTNRTFVVEAAISQSDKPLKANMVAVMKINDYKNNDAVSIPVNLVQNDLKGQYVMIAEENGKDTVAKKVAVKAGVIYNGIAEISEGLKAGDKIISTGYQDIEDGEPLRY